MLFNLKKIMQVPKGLSPKHYQVYLKVSILKEWILAGVPSNPIVNPYYLQGFVEGDGSFGGKFSEDRKGSFTITQKDTNIKLMVALNNFIISEANAKGNVKEFKKITESKGCLYITFGNLTDLADFIVPYFKSLYP